MSIATSPRAWGGALVHAAILLSIPVSLAAEPAAKPAATTAAKPAAKTAPEAPAPPKRTVALLLYEHVELLDFSGPGEAFQAARGDAGPLFEVVTVAETARPITSQGFVTVTPRYSIADCPMPQLLVLPGGGVDSVLRSPALIEWVRKVAAQADVVMSVCNGALILARAGLLDGLEATTHWGTLPALELCAPRTKVHWDRRYVDNGRIVTTAGVSAGIDGALHVIARLHGADAARQTAVYMQYFWSAGATADSTALRQPQPPVAKVVRTLRRQGQAAAVAELRGMEAAGNAPAERTINAYGYRALAAAPTPEIALELFRFNVAAFPKSANTHDSLAEALLGAGEYSAAVASYRASLQLDPQNQNAVSMLHSIATRENELDQQTLHELRELSANHWTAPRVEVAPPGEPGTPLVVTGVVRDTAGRPLPGVRLHVFQTDAAGHYRRGSDDESQARLFGDVVTGSDGAYEIRTVRPGAYAWSAQTPQHVHFQVHAPGYARVAGNGPASLFFADDPRLTDEGRAEIRTDGAHLGDVVTDPDGTQRVVYDITLRRVS